jgi:4-hydroxy-2-oxoheptanedioate aldolase
MRICVVLANAKFDWIWIDLEHGMLDLETAYQMVVATQATPCAPLVRVADNQDWQIKQALDLGPYGVIIPLVRTAEQAQHAVRASKYPPEGIRGIAGRYAAYRWGVPVSEYWRRCNEELLVIVQIEEQEGVAKIEEIMAVPGVDLVFIGTADLSGSVGCIGEPSNVKVEEQVKRIVEASKKTGVPIGIVAKHPADINRRIEQGFVFFLSGTDASMMLEGSASTLTGLNTGRGKASHPTTGAVPQPAEEAAVSGGEKLR